MMFMLIVTLTSMLVAAAMSLVAWRVAGEERRRSDARVDALAAEIHGIATAAASQSARWRVPLATAIAVGVLLGGGVAALAVVSNSRPRTALPIELVELGDERDGDRLTVHGVLHIPAAASSQDRLTAVVSFFDRDGGLLGSSRAAVESEAMAPGSQGIFVVTMPAAAEVERYRVSFRTGDSIVPHIDRRREG